MGTEPSQQCGRALRVSLMHGRQEDSLQRVQLLVRVPAQPRNVAEGCK